jgi:iron complex outermembrane receptor protein
MRLVVIACLLCSSIPLFAQEESSDSTRVLDEVVVKAYRSDRPLRDVPVTVNVIDTKDLNRFGPLSMVTPVNTIPGVRMEERSPGSYRFSIRGSVLRSPFGIRNVKFYWKGLPFTDAGGNTYLNLLDMSTVGRMEIIKGPGASLYGAGTGGVVLLESPDATKEEGRLTYTGGSYGLFRLAGGFNVKIGQTNVELGISTQANDGYREQTAMARSNIRMNIESPIKKKGKITFAMLGAWLAYQTPGGLNATQFEDDPTQARPATPATPGAVEQNAAIANNTNYLALSYQHDWNEHWSSTFGLNTMITRFKNPAILNYEERQEDNWGGRTETQYIFGKDQQKGKITFGAELQSLQSTVKVFDNNQGDPGVDRTWDHLDSKSFFAFAQAEFELPYRFLVTAGGSMNYLKYDFERYSTTPPITQERKFEGKFYPRLALIKKLTDDFSIYSSISQGFSAPTLAEVRPSTGNFNNDLNAESGRSIEVGVRNEFFQRQLKLNVAVYDFKLRETIVVQAAQNGADYFINAGTTSQKGIESTLTWEPAWGRQNMENFRLWASYTYNDYHFLNYMNNSNDFSGNRITGVPPTVFITGIDIMLKKGWYTNLVLNYTDHIPVNDANTEFAKEYKVLSIRLGKRQNIWRFRNVELFGGIDNASNERYSLGNDLNAAGGRYYNLAPARNFYAGITIPLVTGVPKTE